MLHPPTVVHYDTYCSLQIFINTNSTRDIKDVKDLPYVKEFINKLTPIEKEFIDDIMSKIRARVDYDIINLTVIESIINRYAILLVNRNRERSLYQK